jgi:HEAT repeat protein
VTVAARLRSADPVVCGAAIEELAARGGAASDEIDALVACLGHGGRGVPRRAAELLATLEGKGAPIRERLLATLGSSRPGERWGATFALARCGPVPLAAVPVLLETVAGDDGDKRWAAAAIIAGMRDRPEIPDALVRLVRDGEPVARKMALYCLRDIGCSSAPVDDALRAALGDPEPAVRLAALSALAHLAADRSAAGGRLIAALGDPEARVRRAAAAALGVLGERTPAVLAALRGAASADDAALRRAAERSLGVLAP